jgi:multicomponent Na+:H+ antiporter subunit G
MDGLAMILRDAATWLSFLVGGAFLVIGALGVVRLPDFWARLHAAGIIDTAGAAFVLLGMMLQAGFTQVTIKLILIGLFIFFTSPTATHAVADAAYTAGVKPVDLLRHDWKTERERPDT